MTAFWKSVLWLLLLSAATAFGQVLSPALPSTGNLWNYTESSRLTGGDLGANGFTNWSGNSRHTLTAIGDRTQTKTGNTYRVFVLSTSGTTSMSGSSLFTGVYQSIQITNGTDNGELWLRESDLALVRRSNRSQGTLEWLTGGIFWFPLGSYDTTSVQEYDPPLQTYSFPLAVGNSWQSTVREYAFGSKFENGVTTTYDRNQTYTLSSECVAVETKQGVSSYKVRATASNNPAVIENWYAPGIGYESAREVTGGTLDTLVLEYNRSRLSSYTFTPQPTSTATPTSTPTPTNTATPSPLVTPTPTPSTWVLPVERGWGLLGLSFAPLADQAAALVAPSSPIDRAYLLRRGSRLQALSTHATSVLLPFVGVLTYAPAAGEIALSGYPQREVELRLRTGWNLLSGYGLGIGTEPGARTAQELIAVLNQAAGADLVRQVVLLEKGRWVVIAPGMAADRELELGTACFVWATGPAVLGVVYGEPGP